MWLVIGTREKTERVPNGRQVERHCSECGEVAMFYERRAVSTLQLYFLNVVDYRSRIVMACGACGALRSDSEERRPAEPQATDDPLADEDAALEARFKELEKRTRIRID